MSYSINIIFPHQLFQESPLLENGHKVYLIEEYLYFSQYKFHKQKIAFHRASMKYYQGFLENKGIRVEYIDAQDKRSDIRIFNQEIRKKKITSIYYIDPVDNWLSKRLNKSCLEIETYELPTQQFINSNESLLPFFRKDKKSYFQTTFYKQQRKKLDILLNEDGSPSGGKWTYDIENRKKYPKGKTPPSIHMPEQSAYWKEANTYVQTHFDSNPGLLTEYPIYPMTHSEANQWFIQFLDFRFHDFGTYEDAIVKHQSILHHSVLSPLLNSGLLMPEKVVSKSLAYSQEANIPINSTEGFIRQIIGWREFIRGMYQCKGSFSRTANFWNFSRPIPPSFYNGTTGIAPVDETIKMVLKTGYCHHIERLMILGNFMLLCEFNPDEVYQWFMELFIDAYDWVMVPNVYGMSQFADGGTFATKPYIGGSNYIKKMSNYPSGKWTEIWDGLFWRFISNHASFFKSNPRTSMMHHTLNRMSDEKRNLHLKNANNFLQKLESAST